MCIQKSIKSKLDLCPYLWKWELTEPTGLVILILQYRRVTLKTLILTHKLTHYQSALVIYNRVTSSLLLSNVFSQNKSKILVLYSGALS